MKYIIKNEMLFDATERKFTVKDSVTGKERIIYLSNMESQILQIIIDSGSSPIKLMSLVKMYYKLDYDVYNPEICIMQTIRSLRCKDDFIRTNLVNIKKRGYMFNRIGEVVIEDDNPVETSNTYEITETSVEHLKNMFDQIVEKYKGKKLIVGYAVINE